VPDGKSCYLEIPATDVDASAAFYERVFGWKSRLRATATGDAFATFLDPAGNLLGLYQEPPQR